MRRPNAGDEEPRLTQAEFEALRRLLPLKDGVCGDPSALESLRAKHLVRSDGDAWVVTIDGHRSYLRDLMKSF